MRLNDFVVIDIETTGLSPQNDEIIELAALRVRDGAIVSSFESLVKPDCEISNGITALTGITNTMVANAPYINGVIGDYLAFIGGDIVIGHNVAFDWAFIKHAAIETGFDIPDNDRIDTLNLAQYLLPHLNCHSLSYLIDCYNIKSFGSHRALADCKSTYDVYYCLINKTPLIDIDPEPYKKRSPIYSSKTDLKNIKSTKTEFDETHPLFGQLVVFTGVLKEFEIRDEAAQKVVDLGGKCANNITKKTNLLIKADAGAGKTKLEKAENYISKGQDIKIISEDEFYKLLEE